MFANIVSQYDNDFTNTGKISVNIVTLHHKDKWRNKLLAFYCTADKTPTKNLPGQKIMVLVSLPFSFRLERVLVNSVVNLTCLVNHVWFL